jgi:hypothetical protein
VELIFRIAGETYRIHTRFKQVHGRRCDWRYVHWLLIHLQQSITNVKLGDGSKLMRDFNPVLSRVVSCLELSKLARRVDGEALGAGNTLISLTNLSKRYLGFPLSKDPNVRSGNWAGTLDQQQKDCRFSFLVLSCLAANSQTRQMTFMPLWGFTTNL